ncbi:helix-turn-helix domain-containing protein [Janthinobacterium sp. 78]|uniref:helix-turn-helix domain-containing protein n=1 Tax=Janthinobacterium sp. 78 TaxID=2135631 RepID=UPI000D5CA0E1|nr:helix-turn-helix domain-containing protein [Janthinobacterium sp. 78]PVX35002.1 helix-turn-helix protein [Janthinobacterium sp. 78]
MTNTYPIRFPAQLRQHLRALRKKRGLTQADVAALIGVSQARIAEIEANPGLVSFDQMMKLLSAVGVTITLSEATKMSNDAHNETLINTPTTLTDDRTETLRKVLESLGPARETIEESSNAMSKAVESLEGKESVRKAIEEISLKEALRKVLESLGPAHKTIEESSNAMSKAVESLEGKESVRKAMEEISLKEALRKFHESANNAVEESTSENAMRKALESLGGKEAVLKAMKEGSSTQALNNALESLGGADLVRKAVEEGSSTAALAKALESLGGADLVRKSIETVNMSEALRKYLELESISYRNRLNHTKKGTW